MANNNRDNKKAKVAIMREKNNFKTMKKSHLFQELYAFLLPKRLDKIVAKYMNNLMSKNFRNKDTFPNKCFYQLFIL